MFTYSFKTETFFGNGGSNFKNIAIFSWYYEMNTVKSKSILKSSGWKYNLLYQGIDYIKCVQFFNYVFQNERRNSHILTNERYIKMTRVTKRSYRNQFLCLNSSNKDYERKLKTIFWPSFCLYKIVFSLLFRLKFFEISGDILIRFYHN